jgi:peptidoglycan hydrolase-like protein with peptidoglycan-binding domain
MTEEITVLSALRRGSKGKRVYIWQSFLKGKGFRPGEPDGDCGKQTEEATIEYQRRYGLSIDGVAGQ